MQMKHRKTSINVCEKKMFKGKFLSALIFLHSSLTRELQRSALLYEREKRMNLNLWVCHEPWRKWSETKKLRHNSVIGSSHHLALTFKIYSPLIIDYHTYCWGSVAIITVWYQSKKILLHRRRFWEVCDYNYCCIPRRYTLQIEQNLLLKNVSQTMP